VFRILFATDGSRSAREARAFAAALPLAAGDAIHVICVAHAPAAELAHVAGPGGDGWLLDHIVKTARATAAAILAEDAAALARDGVAVTTAMLEGEPAHAILQAADELPADLVVVGSRGLTGIEGLIMGSVARNVARHARRPVVVAHAPERGLARVVLGVDGSEHSRHAAAFLVRLPLPPAAEVVVAHVVRPPHADSLLPQWDPEAARAAEAALRRRAELAGERCIAAALAVLEAGHRAARPALREGDAALELANLATEDGADLIAAGARGGSRIEGLLVGSVADRLLRVEGRSVLLVP
jgi:nucleotide-binding universal stress UspA family protein